MTSKKLNRAQSSHVFKAMCDQSSLAWLCALITFPLFLYYPSCPYSFTEASTICSSAITLQTDFLMCHQTTQGRWKTSSGNVLFGQAAVPSVCTALILLLQVKYLLPLNATLNQQNKATFWILQPWRLGEGKMTQVGSKCDSVREKAGKPNIQ